VDAHRRHAPYGLDDIIRSQSSSDNDGNLDSFYDFAIDVPAVGHSEGTYLHITWPMAVQKQQVGYSIVAPCKRDTFVTDDWNAPHQGQGAVAAFELAYRRWREQIGRRGKMHNSRFQL